MAGPWSAFYVAPFHNQWNAQIADFRGAGVRVHLLPLTLGRGVYSDRGPWIGAGKMDFTEVDEPLAILRVDPDRYILFYLATDPYRSGRGAPDRGLRRSKWPEGGRPDASQGL